MTLVKKLIFITLCFNIMNCFCDVEKGEFEFKFENAEKKEEFLRTFEKLTSADRIFLTLVESNDIVNLFVYRDKIAFLEAVEDDLRYRFYTNSMSKYVTVNGLIEDKDMLVNNNHVITDIKTNKVEFNISQTDIDKYSLLDNEFKKLKKNLFNDKDYCFPIFNEKYSEYIKNNHKSFNIVLKNNKIFITLNKEYVEKNFFKKKYEYYVYLYIDEVKKKDGYEIDDLYMKILFNEKHEIRKYYIWSVGEKYTTEKLIEQFKNRIRKDDVSEFKLCYDTGAEIKEKQLLDPGNYYIKNDRFYIKKTDIDLYNKFLEKYNILKNSVKELISKKSIQQVEFSEVMNNINDFFRNYDDNINSEIRKQYQTLFENVNYEENFRHMFTELNDLRRELMINYIHLLGINEMIEIIAEFNKENFDGFSYTDFFNYRGEYECYFIKLLVEFYEKFKKNFVQEFIVNNETFTNDYHECNKKRNQTESIQSEIIQFVLYEERTKSYGLDDKLKNLVEKNKDKFFKNVYKISTDIIDLYEKNDIKFKNLINDINCNINNKVFHRAEENEFSYSDLLKELRLYYIFYKYQNYHNAPFFDIYIDGKKKIFEGKKNIKDLENEYLPKGVHEIQLKFYECVSVKNSCSDKLDKDDFYNFLIAQIGRKDYEEKEIEKINNIDSKEELFKNYKEIIAAKGKYDFWNKIESIQNGAYKCEYKYSNEMQWNKISNLPKIYDCLIKRLNELEKTKDTTKEVENAAHKKEKHINNIVYKSEHENELNTLTNLPYSTKKKNVEQLKNNILPTDYNDKRSKITNINEHEKNIKKSTINTSSCCCSKCSCRTNNI